MSEDKKETTGQTSLNDQIIDSIASMQSLLHGNSGDDVSLIAYQVMAQAAGLAMLNAVNQQQQMYILQNAVTTAAAKSALESNPDEALKIINDVLKNNSVVDILNGLKNFIDELTKTYNELKKNIKAEDKTTQQPQGKKVNSKARKKK